MSSRRRTHRRRAAVASVLAALSVPLAGPAAALAVPADSPVAPSTAQPAPRIGDTPAEFAQPVAAAPKAGDTPADYPGASRTPGYDPPTTIEVVRPERTVVRETTPVLPLVIGGVALLIALGAAGSSLVTARHLRLG